MSGMMFEFGTKRTERVSLAMSVDRSRPEVSGTASK
jgi:hypothetical protein